MTHPARRWRSAALTAVALLPAVSVRAEPTIADLLQRIEEQEQKILVLERKLEINDEAAKSAASSNAVAKASPKGFSLQSADGADQIKLRGTLHFDGRFMASDETDLPDQWQATRVRPIFEGTLGGIYDFKFMPDFGQGRTVIQDAYVTGRFDPAFQVTAGKFKSPVGLERLQSANDIRFVQRGFPTSLVPNRDLGVQVGGGVLGDRLSYQVGWFNGSNDGSSSETFTDVDVNSDKEWAARLFTHPFAESENFLLRGLGLGIAGTYTDQRGTLAQPLLPSFRSSGGYTFFRYRTGTTPTVANGERLRIAPQFYYYAGSFGLLGEYTEVEQEISRTINVSTFRTDTVNTSAWQLAAAWFLTGEEQAYRGFKPNTTFSLEKGTWGAWELVARYHELEVGDEAFAGGSSSFADPLASASKASAWALGLNWYLNQNVKWVLNYEQTSFDGGPDRDDEKAILTRVALSF